MKSLWFLVSCLIALPTQAIEFRLSDYWPKRPNQHEGGNNRNPLLLSRALTSASLSPNFTIIKREFNLPQAGKEWWQPYLWNRYLINVKQGSKDHLRLKANEFATGGIRHMERWVSQKKWSAFSGRCYNESTHQELPRPGLLVAYAKPSFFVPNDRWNKKQRIYDDLSFFIHVPGDENKNAHHYDSIKEIDTELFNYGVAQKKNTIDYVQLESDIVGGKIHSVNTEQDLKYELTHINTVLFHELSGANRFVGKVTSLDGKKTHWVCRFYPPFVNDSILAEDLSAIESKVPWQLIYDTQTKRYYRHDGNRTGLFASKDATPPRYQVYTRWSDRSGTYAYSIVENGEVTWKTRRK